MNSTKINARKIILIIALAFLNALSISQITEMTEISGLYFGSAIYGWNPSCMAFFALDCILLNRFLKKDVLKDKRRLFVSSLLGVLIGLLSVLGIGMYYGNSTIFDNATPPVLLFFLALGLSFLIIPILSELIGLLNAVCNKTDEISKKTSFFEKHPWVYFVIIWAIVFASFMPLFLYWWPGNFVYDADYQVYDYLTDTISTHHPILHTLLLGKAYEWGYNRGNVNNGIMIYTLIQMFVLSGSVAFFMEYLCQRKVKKSIRLIILLSFVLNPVNAWFAISTIKGVLSAAFLIVSLTFLLRYFDCEKKEKIKKILSAIGFAVFCILSCHFRNNMIYAVILGGIIIALLRKGVKEKLIFAALVVAIVIGFKGSNKILISATNASEKDTQRETFSVPLLCLARVAIKCRDKIGEANYGEICAYIPEYKLEDYSITLADGIKNDANEALLRSNKANFLKLVIKMGLKCPKEYLETVIGLTMGYWYPLNYPYFFTGPTKLFDKPINGGYPGIENRNLLPFGGAVFEYLFNDEDGRLKIPLLGWTWRNTLYFWGYIFAFAYLCYKKDKRGLALVIIPLLYMLSCLLGPVSWMRYIYPNIATVPIIVYLCTHAKNRKA